MVVGAAEVAVVGAVDDPVVDPVLDAVVDSVVPTDWLPGVDTAELLAAVVGVAAVVVGATVIGVVDGVDGVVDVLLLPHEAVTTASVMNAADQRVALCLFMKSPRIERLRAM